MPLKASLKKFVASVLGAALLALGGVFITSPIAFAASTSIGSPYPGDRPFWFEEDGVHFATTLSAHQEINLGIGSLHLDPNNGHPGGAFIGTKFIPWEALGIEPGECITWGQWGGAPNYHFGEDNSGRGGVDERGWKFCVPPPPDTQCVEYEWVKYGKEYRHRGWLQPSEHKVVTTTWRFDRDAPGVTPINGVLVPGEWANQGGISSEYELPSEVTNAAWGPSGPPTSIIPPTATAENPASGTVSLTLYGAPAAAGTVPWKGWLVPEGEWSGWSNWSSTNPGPATDTRQVETRKVITNGPIWSNTSPGTGWEKTGKSRQGTGCETDNPVEPAVTYHPSVCQGSAPSAPYLTVTLTPVPGVTYTFSVEPDSNGRFFEDVVVTAVADENLVLPPGDWTWPLQVPTELAEDCSTEPDIEYSEWQDEEWVCGDVSVTITRTKTTIPKIKIDGEWVRDEANAVTTTETSSRELTEVEVAAKCSIEIPVTPPPSKATCEADGSLPELIETDAYTATWDRPFNGPGVYTAVYTKKVPGTFFVGGETTVTHEVTVEKRTGEGNCKLPPTGASVIMPLAVGSLLVVLGSIALLAAHRTRKIGKHVA